MRIEIPSGIDGFMEDKDLARSIRLEKILPALDRNESVILDFSNVSYTTQSFVHALIGEALKKYKESALNSLEFHNCNQGIKSVIEIVVDYAFFNSSNQSKRVNHDVIMPSN